jgi:hypothetical protein
MSGTDMQIVPSINVSFSKSAQMRVKADEIGKSSKNRFAKTRRFNAPLSCTALCVRLRMRQGIWTKFQMAGIHNKIKDINRPL